jgi:hypothetical protein
MRKLIGPVIVVTTFFYSCPASRSHVAKPVETPFNVEVLEIQDFKENQFSRPTKASRAYTVRLTLKNQQEKPVWFVLPYWGDEKLPENGVFLNKEWDRLPFGGHGYDGEGGSATHIFMYGGCGFKAFQLPPGGSLGLSRYRFDGAKDFNQLVIMQVLDLKVNGTTSLDKWLPYATICSKQVKVSEDTMRIYWKNLDWDGKTNRERDDYPMEEVREVRADGIRYWTITLPGAKKPKGGTSD